MMCIQNNYKIIHFLLKMIPLLGIATELCMCDVNTLPIHGVHRYSGILNLCVSVCLRV